MHFVAASHSFPIQQHSFSHAFDHRRMSYPIHYTPPLPDIHHSHPYPHTAGPGVPAPPPAWKSEDDVYAPASFDEPLSPFRPSFSGAPPPSPSSALPYPPILEDPYGPSPPGTGTSCSSAPGPPGPQPLTPASSSAPPPPATASNSSKTYAFVSLPGNAVKKRPRRRYDEIERLYQCSWPDCTKAYGTLNHLNAHVTMQKHGLKRSPSEFKELRKQWRKAKKEESDSLRSLVSHPHQHPHFHPQHGRAALGGPSLRRESAPDLHSLARGSPAYAGTAHRHRLSLGLPVSPGLLNTSIPAGSSALALDTATLRYPMEDLGTPHAREDGYDAVRHHPHHPHHQQQQQQQQQQQAQQQRYSNGWQHAQHTGMNTPLSPRPPMPLQPLYAAHDHEQQRHAIYGGGGGGGDALPLDGGADMGRLPADSTLLTPLPGYEPAAPAQQFGYAAYSGEVSPGGAHHAHAQHHHHHYHHHAQHGYADDGARPGTADSAGVYGDGLRTGTGRGRSSADGEYEL